MFYLCIFVVLGVLRSGRDGFVALHVILQCEFGYEKFWAVSALERPLEWYDLNTNNSFFKKNIFRTKKKLNTHHSAVNQHHVAVQRASQLASIVTQGACERPIMSSWEIFFFTNF